MEKTRTFLRELKWLHCMWTGVLLDEWYERLVAVGGNSNKREVGPATRILGTEVIRLDKILTPRSPQLIRTYKLFSDPIKQYITIRLYVYVVRRCFISRLREAGAHSVYTHIQYVHTHANQLRQTLPNSNSATDRLLRSERQQASSRAKGFF